MPPVSCDILIRDGRVLDGTGSPPLRRNLAVTGDQVRLLEPGRPAQGETELNAAGFFVAPGFIDIHSHSDMTSLICPNATARVAAGAVTECNGNCGYGAFPLAGDVLARRRQEYPPEQLDIDWTDAADYFARADAIGSAINRVTLIGHGAVRGVVIGYGDRKAAPAEIDRMCRIVDEAMTAGCAGLSSGLIYAPGMWADVDEMTALARVVAGYDGVYASHIRSESVDLLEAADEFLQVLRRSGCRGQFSHIKTSGKANWGKIGRLHHKLLDARADGVEVSADRYPYLASATDLATLVLPGWALAGTPDEVAARLADKTMRGKIAAAVRAKHGDHLDHWLESIYVTSTASADLRACMGKNLRQVPEVMGLADPLEATFKLIHDDRALTNAISFSMSEANLREIYSWPFVAMGSDSSLRDYLGPVDKDRPHPRAYGSPARFLELTVRKWKLLDWPEAVQRMTSLPAKILGLGDRGVLRDGAKADIVIFDGDTIADVATYEDPCRAPAGIRTTIVNGQIVWNAGRHTGRRPGRMLKRS